MPTTFLPLKLYKKPKLSANTMNYAPWNQNITSWNESILMWNQLIINNLNSSKDWFSAFYKLQYHFMHFLKLLLINMLHQHFDEIWMKRISTSKNSLKWHGIISYILMQCTEIYINHLALILSLERKCKKKCKSKRQVSSKPESAKK